jgi:hypothetical protein
VLLSAPEFSIITQFNKMSEVPKHLSRREVLGLAGKSIFLSGLLNSLNIKNVIDAGTDQTDVRIPEYGDKLQVTNFAPDIINTCNRLTGNPRVENVSGMITGSFLTTAVGEYLLRNYPSKTKRIIGGASGATGKTIDLISTLMCVHYVNDPKLKEYGLDEYFVETSPLSSKHPSSEKATLWGLAEAALIGSYGVMIPALGEATLGEEPFLAKSNYGFANQMQVSIKLGDAVKSLIEAGSSPQYITDFLQRVKLITLVSKTRG